MRKYTPIPTSGNMFPPKKGKLQYYPSTPIGFANDYSEGVYQPKKVVVNLSKPFRAFIQFKVDNKHWCPGSKVFENERHMENWIAVIERKPGYTCDDVFLKCNV